MGGVAAVPMTGTSTGNVRVDTVLARSISATYNVVPGDNGTKDPSPYPIRGIGSTGSPVRGPTPGIRRATRVVEFKDRTDVLVIMEVQSPFYVPRDSCDFTVSS